MTQPIEDAEDLILRNTLLTANEWGGAYELVWWLDTRFPDADVATKYRVAHASLRTLIVEGHVSLVYASHPGADPDCPVPPAEALDLLHRPTAWYPSDPAQGNRTLELRLTSSGVERLRITSIADLMDGTTRVKSGPA